MAIIITLFMNLVVVSCASLVTYRFLKPSILWDSFIYLFILYFSQIILSELILGVLGALYLKNLILINAGLLLVIWIISRGRVSSFKLGVKKGEISGLFSNKIALFLVSIILCFGAVKIFVNLVNPPFGWDDLNYHFTFPVEWLKHANLDNPITVFDDPSPTYYPINGSLFFLWFILPLKSVFLADIGQAPFFLLSFLAIYAISRKMNLDRELSFFAASLFLIIPNLFKQLQIAYVDIMVAALFFACLNCLLLLHKELAYKNILVYSLGLGLLLGTKTTGLPYSILLFAPFIFLCFKNRHKPYLFFASVFIITSVGGFAYIRNFLDAGNPLYPLHVELFGKDIFKGVMDASLYRAHFRIEDYSLSKLLFHEGLGAQSLIFILPSMFFALPLAFFKRRALNPILTYILLLPLLLYFTYRYVIPLANTRYLYPLLGVGIITGFYVVEILNVPRSVMRVLVAICALACVPELAKRQELILSIIATSLFFCLSLFFKKHFRLPRLRERQLFAWPAAFVISVLFFLILLEKDYIRNEYLRYTKMVKYSGFWPDATRAWEWLNKNTHGDNIAYAGRPVPFPLYGDNFKNNVYYVSVNNTEPAKLHYFHDSRYQWGYDFLSLHENLESKGNYRSGADYSVWLNNLLKRSADYLFIYSLHQTKDIAFPFEDTWARDNPHRFKPVFTNHTIHIYKILK